MKTKTILIISALVVTGGIAAYFIFRKKDGTSGKDFTVDDIATIENAGKINSGDTIIIASGDASKPATDRDILILYNSAKKAFTRTTSQWGTFIRGAKKYLNRIETQTLAGYMEKLSMNKTNQSAALTDLEWKNYNKIMKSLTQ